MGEIFTSTRPPVASALQHAMAKKAMKSVKSMSKGGIADSLATACAAKKADMGKLLDALATLATAEVKKAGKFTIPGVCMVKTKHKAATKAGKRIMFGQEMKVKAKPARTVVKCFAVKALKNCV